MHNLDQFWWVCYKNDLGSESYIRYNMSYLGRGVSEQLKTCTKLLLVLGFVEDCIRDLGNLVSLQIFQFLFQVFNQFWLNEHTK